MSKTRVSMLGVAALAGVLAAGQAMAQAWPARPIRMVVPFPVGGGSDSTARILAQRLQDRLKQQLIVENRTGAGGAIGTEYAARAVPDGYTILLGSGSEIVMLPAVATKLSFDPLKDFVAIARVADVPLLLVTHPALPVKNARELIELARKRPGDINYGSAGNGSTSHLSMALFNSVTGTKMVHVPYKGSVQATTDLVGGMLQAGTNTMPAALPFVKSGRLRALAITTPRRSPLLPDVPTVGESGVPGYEVTLWTGVFAPTGTPKEIVAQYGREIEGSLAQPDVKEALAKLGSEANFSPLEPFTAFLKADFAKWVKLTREANIRLDQQ
ncbi:MAG: tripartite tricarboxylate transporter substrate binding protein [Proteobacteria bacterium]|nr:tripartite tricarboxylate transporter substrate binding protein [Pseudomonadota bacterium]